MYEVYIVHLYDMSSEWPGAVFFLFSTLTVMDEAASKQSESHPKTYGIWKHRGHPKVAVLAAVMVLG